MSATSLMRLAYTGAGNASTIATYQPGPSYTAQIAGAIDVPAASDGSETPVVYTVPFDGITSPSFCLVANKTEFDLGIRLQSAVADEFNLPPGGFFCMGASAGAGTNGLAAIDVVLNSLTTADGKIEFIILGS